MSESETPRWLRDQLSRHLAGVRAPEGLWHRIESARRPVVSLPRYHWTRWAVAATVTLATAVGTYWMPGPQMRSDVLVVSSQPDLRPDNPTDWDLRCTTPAARSVFRVANLSAQRGHQFALAVSGLEDEAVSCQACHSMGLGQHHL